MTELKRIEACFAGHEPGPMGVHRRYAVLCPLLETADGVRVLFEVRAPGVRQPGEVCFPGGAAEKGETAEACALRETQEELGIPAEDIRLLGRSDFLIHQRGFLLQPVLGLLCARTQETLRPAAAEVAEVFTVPLDYFRRFPPEVLTYTLEPGLPADFPYARLGIPKDYPWGRGRVEVPVWNYEGHVIWGITARILKNILGQLSE